MQPISVLLADDQTLLRNALEAMLSHESGITVVGQAEDGAQAVELARRLRPRVVLMDVRMPVLSGPDATARIRADRSLADTRILILTTFEDGDVVRACLRAGADGFVGKSISATALVEAIFAVSRGELPLSPKAARAALAARRPLEAVRGAEELSRFGLTKREMAILKLVGMGLSNDEIGRRLEISPATAKTHVRNATRKLRVRDRAQLIALVNRSELA